jgi:hypothetical protein
MARRRSKAAVPADAAPGTLAPHAAQARVQELEKERARLIREVQKKQRQLELVEQSARELAESAVARMAPIVERQRGLAQELEALFDELLVAGRLPARARKELERLRRALELQGVLEPRASEDDLESEVDEANWEAPFGQAGGGAREHAHEPRAGDGKPAAREVPGAQQVGQQRRSLRDLFRSLARAIRQEDERQRRTEVMKQVTRAYEEGDLARLIQLESAWESEQAPPGSGDPEVRCRELLRLNRELLDQVREVTRQVRDAKRELAASRLSYPPEDLVELAHAELDDFEGIRDLLRSFRDGKISLSDLTHGPLPAPRRRKRRAV